MPGEDDFEQVFVIEAGLLPGSRRITAGVVSGWKCQPNQADLKA